MALLPRMLAINPFIIKGLAFLISLRVRLNDGFRGRLGFGWVNKDSMQFFLFDSSVYRRLAPCSGC